MRITVDTQHDSHDDIKKVIKMLQHLVGDNQEIFTNQPEIAQEAAASPFQNIFGDASSTESSATSEATTSETAQEAQTEEASDSTEDLFAELFSEEELKNMDSANVKNEDAKEDDDVEVKPKDKKYNIEFY